MNRLFKAIAAVLIGLGILAGLQCEKDTGPGPLPPKVIEILAPKGGETYAVGSTVQVKWRINDATNISSIGLKISLDGGTKYSMLYAVGSFPTDVTTYDWVVAPGQISDKCVIKVYEYFDEPINDKSGLFTVK